MVKASLRAVVIAIALAGVAACGRAQDGSGEPGATGTAGRTEGQASKVGTTLTGCLEKNIRTGQFELVMQGDSARRSGSPNAGLQPGHERLELNPGEDVELNQHVGQRVTVEGALGAGQPVSDAGTRSYGAGEGADSSQTRSREGDSRRMTVTSVKSTGEDCALEKR
jgi:hypothetical protein